MQIVGCLLKLTLPTTKMATGAKQDVHWWKETVFILSDYSFMRRESSQFELLSENF